MVKKFFDMNKALVEIRRVLKKGGVLLSLEFSDINSSLLKKLFYFYENLFQNLQVYY